MSTTITGKLNKPARIFSAGEYTGYSIRIGEQVYNRKTKEKEWTNYDATLFTKSPNQNAFYEQNLLAGAIVSVTAEKSLVEIYEGRGTISLQEAKLSFVSYNGTAPAPQQSAPQHQQRAPYQPPQQTAPPAQYQQPAPSQQFQAPPMPEYTATVDDLDDESIPF